MNILSELVYDLECISYVAALFHFGKMSDSPGAGRGIPRSIISPRQCANFCGGYGIREEVYGCAQNVRENVRIMLYFAIIKCRCLTRFRWSIAGKYRDLLSMFGGSQNSPVTFSLSTVGTDETEAFPEQRQVSSNFTMRGQGFLEDPVVGSPQNPTMDDIFHQYSDAAAFMQLASTFPASPSFMPALDGQHGQFDLFGVDPDAADHLWH